MRHDRCSIRRLSLLTTLLAGLSLAAGCTTTRHVWRKDGVTSDQAQREHATCLYQAEVLCGTQYALTEVELQNRHARFEWLYRQCMMASGYQDQVIEE